jgi:DNA-binding transcriptional ArsR family regulator
MVEYSPSQLDLVYKAISHPVRRAVLERLRPRPARVTELAAPFDMSLAAVSKHIRVLENAGLVRRAVRGRDHEVSLEPTPLMTAAKWLATYQAFWESRLDGTPRCGSVQSALGGQIGPCPLT